MRREEPLNLPVARQANTISKELGSIKVHSKAILNILFLTCIDIVKAYKENYEDALPFAVAVDLLTPNSGS